MKTTVDTELSGGVGDTDGVEDLGEVVGDETVTGPLREEGNGDDDPHAASVTGGGEQAAVTDVSGNGAIELDGGLDLLVLVKDERVLVVAVRVVVTEDVESLLLTTLGDQPTRGLGNEPDEEDLGDGGESLEGRGDTPRPSVLDVEGTEGRPGGDDSTRVPERVVEGSQLGTVGGVGQLRDEEGSGVGSEGQTETHCDAS